MVEYSAADLRALTRRCARCLRNLAFLALLPMAVSALSIWLDGQSDDLIGTLLGSGVLGLVMALAVYWLSPIYLQRARRRNGWDSPIEIRLEEACVASRHPAQNAEYFWSAIKDVAVANGRLFIFTSPGCAIILPRRAFASDEQFDSWVQTAKARFFTARAEDVQS